jgi:hypothetical protein
MAATDPPDSRAGVAWGEGGRCVACGGALRPDGDEVAEWAYGLWDDTLGAVRGGKFFRVTCPACGAPLISREVSGVQWADLDPSTVQWRIDHWPRPA